MIIALAAFVGVLAIVLGAYWLFILRPEGAAERAVRRRLAPNNTARVVKRSSLVKRVVPLSTVPLLEKVFKRAQTLVRPVQRLVEQSGLSVTVGQLVLGCLFLGSVVGSIVLHLTANPWIAIAAWVLVMPLPFGAVRYAARRRLA